MKMLSKKQTIFIGQSIEYSGNAIYNTLQGIPSHKKLELPVFEEVQMGMSLGWLWMDIYQYQFIRDLIFFY